MARTPRRESASDIHHVMNRGVDRQTIFFTDHDRLDFEALLAQACEQHGIELLAFCLMGNHFHLLVRAPTGALSVAMQWACGTYVRHVNDRLGRDGPLLRGRFLSIPVETDRYLVTVARYIHRNPLDLPGVTSASAYRWSSLPMYLGTRPCPGHVETATLLGYFDSPESLRTFTEDPEAAPPGTVASSWSAADLRSMVAYAIARDDLEADPGDVVRQSLDRVILALVARRTDGGLQDAALSALGSPSPGAVKMAGSRAERRLRADPAVTRVLARVMDDLRGLRPAA